MQVSPVPASDEVCPPDFWELLAMRCFGGIPSCEKCWIQVSPVPASDEVCPPCIMAFLLRERKDVLLEVAKELRVEIDITFSKIEFKKRICQSKYYDEESVKCLLEGILEEKREEREKWEIKKFEERKLIRELELQRLRAQLRKRTADVSEPVNKCRPLINPVVNESVENATSCDFEKKNCDPQDKGVANPEGLICENICEEKYTFGTLMGCEKQLTLDRESFRNYTIAKIAGQGGKENTCKADVLKGLEDGLAMRLLLSESREIYKDNLETDNRSNIGSEYTFEIDLPEKRDNSTIYRLNLIKLYRRKPELANLVVENSSEGIDSETFYSVKLFMDFGFQGNLRKSQLYFKLPPDRSSYLRMINAKKKERFLPESGTWKDINLVTGKPFRIKTCCSSQMLINSLREDTEYLLDLGVNGMGQSNRTLPVVWLGRVNRYPYPRIKCIKYRNLNQVTRAEIFFKKGKFGRKDQRGIVGDCTGFVEVVFSSFSNDELSEAHHMRYDSCMYIIKKSRFKFLCAYDGCNLTTLILRLLEQIDVSRMVDIDILIQIWKNRVKEIGFVLKWLSRVGSEVGPTKVLCEGNTRNRWRDGQVCPDVDKELWRLGPDGSGVFWRVMRKSDEGGQERLLGKKEVGRGGRVQSGRENGRKEKRERTEGVRDWSGKTMNAGGVENGL
ncbi:uncharacterized protein TNCV_1486761 [Trichonephila clavipes]|nr:uncharacterized protein TNCV_1486761 [Trichonephila clavipes]